MSYNSDTQFSPQKPVPPVMSPPVLQLSVPVPGSAVTVPLCQRALTV